MSDDAKKKVKKRSWLIVILIILAFVAIILVSYEIGYKIGYNMTIEEGAQIISNYI